MQTRHLKTLVQIAQVESFATAASQLNMTLPALSMQMKTLEEELQASLFDRSHRPPKLTPMGRDIVEKAKKVLAAEKALVDCSHGNAGLNGSYRMGFVATASVRLLPSFLRNAKAKAPNASFDIETALSETLEEKVLSGQLDAAVLTASSKSEAALDYTLIREEKLVFAVPKQLADKSIEEIAKQIGFIQFNPGSGIGKLIANQMRSLISQPPKKPIILDSVEAIMECVNEGIGFTLLAEPDIARYANETVATIPMTQKPLKRQLVLATVKRADNHNIAEALLDLFN